MSNSVSNLTSPPFRSTAGVLVRKRRIAHVSRWISATAVLTAGLVSMPLVYLFVRAFEPGLSTWAGHVLSAGTLQLLYRTLGLTVGVVLLANLVALPAAWLVTRTDLPGRRLWAVLTALPLAFPSYIAAFALVAALGPRGYLQGWLERFGVDRLPEVAYGYSGALLALALFTYPYIFLLVAGTLGRLDPTLEESARLLGAGPWRTFFRVVLPQLRPAALAGSLLVALYSLSDFGAVSIVRFDTFTLSIYNAYRTLFDRSAAAALAIVLIALTFLCLGLEHRLSTTRAGGPGPARQCRPIALGRWRWPALAGLGLLAFATLGVPSAVIVGWALRGVTTGADLANVAVAALSSLGVALITASIAVLLSLPLALWSARDPGRPAWIAERVTSAGYALPGIVVALSLVFLGTRLVPFAYQTLGLLVFAYLVRFLPEALAASRSGFASLPPRFEEAARSLGHRPLSVVVRVIVPMVRPALLAGFGLVFLTTIKELPATLILRPIGFETLATEVWSKAGEGIYSEAALPAIGLLIVCAPVMYAFVIRPALADGKSRT